MHPGALATEIQFTAWRAKEGRFETRTRTVTKIHSGTKPARLRRCSSRLRIISARRVVGGSTAVPPAASSCKVPFFHRGEGGTIIRGVSGKRATKMDTDAVWKMLGHGTKYWGSLGQKSCQASMSSVPTGGMTLVRSRGAASPAASVSRRRLVWSRDQISGHVTTISVTWPPAGRQNCVEQLHKVLTHIVTLGKWQLEVATENDSECKILLDGNPINFQHQFAWRIFTFIMLGTMPPWSWGWGGHVAHARCGLFRSDTQYRHCSTDTCHLPTEQARTSQSVIERPKDRS